MAKEKKLSSEDRILWGKVARSTRPLPGRMEDLQGFEEPVVQPEKPAPVIVKEGKSLAEAFGSADATVQKKVPPKLHQPLEKPVKRKLAKGHLTLEARIDLHGMIQSEAHGFLLHFLLRAHERGLRHVLVITGKGTSLGSDGALKRAVPMWFSLPEFRTLISSYEPAARNHGGDGALCASGAGQRRNVVTPFGEAMHALRGQKGVSQKDMAAAIGVSAAYLSALEHGKRGAPSFEFLQRVAGYFNVIWDEADELFRLASLSDPRVVLDTAGLSPAHTAFANRLAVQIRALSGETIVRLEDVLEKARFADNEL